MCQSCDPLIIQLGDSPLGQRHIAIDRNRHQNIAVILRVKTDIADLANAYPPVANLRLRIEASNVLLGHDNIFV